MYKFSLNKLKSGLKIVLSIILIISCVYNFFNSFEYVCKLIPCSVQDEAKTIVKSIFPRSIAITCFISRIVVMYKSFDEMPKYKRKIKAYELYFPINMFKKKCQRIFTIIITFLYIIIIIPINLIRINLIYYNIPDKFVFLFQTIMYIQNLSICSTEIFFILRCFGLYQHFQLINEEIDAVKSNTINKNKYPVVLQTEEYNEIISPDLNVDFSPSGNSNYQVAHSIELLRMRHQFVRTLVGKLNNIYGIQLGMSLCVLFIMAVFDIYGQVFTNNNKTRSSILIYGWLLQYIFRFNAIIMTTHITTKQAYKTKMLVSDINNRYLDKITKEELYLFFNQIFCRSVEFTVYDLFTLNPHLITAAIATGTTYLVIILQFK